MRVILINPPFDIGRYMGKLSKIAFVFHPIGLAYIASYLRDKDITVKIFDSQVESEPIQSVVKEFKPDVVGITCVTALVPSTIELARLLKEEVPGLTIIVGGIHPTIRPNDFLEQPFIDYVAVGEGEITMYEFVKALQDGRDPAEVPGIMTKRDGVVIAAPPREMEKNIDNFPPPAIDMLPIEKYRMSPDMKMGDKIGLVVSSRGCPFDCIFCSNRILTRGKYREHSIERVCTEISDLIDRYKITQLLIMDDNFAVNKKRAKALCRAFIERGFQKKLSFITEARVDCVDQELLSLMADANCKIISYGIESGNQRLLDLIKKNITLEQARKAVEMTKKVGISVRASFILGLPTETREESLKTVEFAKKLGIDQVRFALATPFPGTKLWDIAQEEGSLKLEDWRQLSMMSGYAGGQLVYTPQGRDAEELARLQRYSNLSFFLRPSVIFGYMKRMNSPSAFKYITLGAIRFLRASLFPGK